MEEYKSTYPLIHNKVTSPHYVTPTLRRARLLDWLNANASARAIVIAAGAGYGKTTLLWQWEREVDFPCYWYKLDRNDRDWTLHISYLVEAISQHYPGFGRRAHSVLRQMGGPGSSRPGVAAFLLAEMHEKLTEPCTFIIDDWQFVASVTEVRGLWNQILRDAPSTCRFVFASRGKPHLQFARFKTHGGYAELRTDRLRLTEGEIAELFSDVYRNPLTTDEAAELERRTEGWAASLQLIEVSMRGRRTPGERRALIETLTATTDSDLFSFLAEEVLDQQSDETRNFLLSTSILQQISPDVAERLAGVPDGIARLIQLEHSGLFTYRLDESRYRYHGLFREFLERRLAEERSDAEVMGLHIHAASYFETTAQWPEAIYHYLKAGLQRQAARLIARYGEGLIHDGRLGMVDEWLEQLPQKAVHDNGRLSLLKGEARGIGGDWSAALEALHRGLEFFQKKGDRRMQALALIKLATVHSHRGDTDRGARAAREALEIAPDDARDLRLRAEGNLVLTQMWLHAQLPDAETELMRITAESAQLGLEHHAAIGLHNLGQMQLEMGDFDRAAKSLEKASQFWSQAPQSPFSDNYNLVVTLLALSAIERAEMYARRGVAATRPWPRVHIEACAALSKVHLTLGRFKDAQAALEPMVMAGAVLGSSAELGAAHYLEAKLLGHALDASAARIANQVRARRLDPRMVLNTEPILAAVEHRMNQCDQKCGMTAWKEAEAWIARGGTFIGADAIVRVGTTLLDHKYPRAPATVAQAIETLRRLGTIRYHRFWLREYTPYAGLLVSLLPTETWETLISTDPAAWSGPALESAIPQLQGEERERLIAAVERHGGQGSISHIPSFKSPQDLRDLRARLVARHAPRLFVRSFGMVSVHRGGWSGSRVEVVKKRERLLMSYLIAHATEAVSREAVLDALWPDAAPAAAVNNLNQTVFQLRRVLDPEYRDGASPPYILSTIDAVGLNLDLVRLDWVELKAKLEDVIAKPEPGEALLRFITGTIRGQYLRESLYEDWSDGPRQRVHQLIRSALLPMVTSDSLNADWRVALGSAIAALDEFDEGAHVALAKALGDSGRRVAGIVLLKDLLRRLHDELDEDGSAPVRAALEDLQAVGVA